MCQADEFTSGTASSAPAEPLQAGVGADAEDIAVQKHFVKFFSPGTFVAEVTEKEIECWSVETAIELARDVIERYNARPYGFQFLTYGRTADELDSSVIAKSPMHFLGGTILTLDEVKARNDPNDRTLIMNMECNGYKRIIVNENSWRWTQPLRDGDIVVEFDPASAQRPIEERSDDEARLGKSQPDTNISAARGETEAQS